MAEFLDQKQAKHEGKKNLIYSHLNITNNFIVKGSLFVEFHIIHSPPLPLPLIPGSQTPAEKAYIQQTQQAQQLTQQSQQRLFRIRQPKSTPTSPRQFSLLTYLVLWSDETIQIYQILGSTLDGTPSLETTLQCSYSVNGRIHGIKTFRRDNNVYLIGFLEKRKMITLLFDRQINTLTCVSQHCFRSAELKELNATCLETDLDDDNAKHHGFHGQADMNTTEHTTNELVAVLISRRILALCFNSQAYDLYVRAAFQNSPSGAPNQFQPPPGAELKQTKQIYAPQTFYLDLQKKYDATHVIDYAVVTLTYNASQQPTSHQLPPTSEPQPQLPRAQRVPFIFLLNKRINHIKEQSTINVQQMQANQELGVVEIVKEIYTELIVVIADLQKLAFQQHQHQMQQQKQQLIQQQQQQSMNRFIDDPSFIQPSSSAPLSQLANKFDHQTKHPQFKKLPQKTYLIKSLENNYILIMSNYYLFVGAPANGFFHFHCLAFNHPHYKMNQLVTEQMNSSSHV